MKSDRIWVFPLEAECANRHADSPRVSLFRARGAFVYFLYRVSGRVIGRFRPFAA